MKLSPTQRAALFEKLKSSGKLSVGKSPGMGAPAAPMAPKMPMPMAPKAPPALTSPGLTKPLPVAPPMNPGLPGNANQVNPNLVGPGKSQRFKKLKSMMGM
jgi:hypothetical protein